MQQRLSLQSTQTHVSSTNSISHHAVLRAHNAVRHTRDTRKIVGKCAHPRADATSSTVHVQQVAHEFCPGVKFSVSDTGNSLQGIHHCKLNTLLPSKSVQAKLCLIRQTHWDKRHSPCHAQLLYQSITSTMLKWTKVAQRRILGRQIPHDEESQARGWLAHASYPHNLPELSVFSHTKHCTAKNASRRERECTRTECLPFHMFANFSEMPN